MNPRRAWLLGGIAFCLVAAQAALGPSLGGLLRRAIEGRATELAALEVRVAPVNWLDLFSGRIRRVEIQAQQISFGGPRFALLAMDLREISLSPRALFLHGEAAVRALGPSRVVARIEEEALNDYCRRAYPNLPVQVRVGGGRVGLTGRLSLFGHELSFSTSGRLQAAGGDRLRYVPEEIEAAGKRLPASWLAAYGENLALEFPLEIPLPLVLREIRAAEGHLQLILEESAAARP